MTPHITYISIPYRYQQPLSFHDHCAWLTEHLGEKTRPGPFNEEDLLGRKEYWSVHLDPVQDMLIYRIKDHQDIAALFKLTWL